MASIFEILSKSLNVAIKFRGFWSPAGGTLPSTSVYPIGSILVASDTGTILGTTYPINSLLLNNNNTWLVVGSSTTTNNLIENPAPIEYLVAPANTSLNDYDGLDEEDEFIYQIVTFSSGVVGTTTNLPVGERGVLEVFGSLNVQRFTTETGRIFTRLTGDSVWSEIVTDTTELQQAIQIILDEQYDLYSISGITTSS